jgi:hypothetical protein
MQVLVADTASVASTTDSCAQHISHCRIHLLRMNHATNTSTYWMQVRRLDATVRTAKVMHWMVRHNAATQEQNTWLECASNCIVHIAPITSLATSINLSDDMIIPAPHFASRVHLIDNALFGKK